MGRVCSREPGVGFGRGMVEITVALRPLSGHFSPDLEIMTDRRYRARSLIETS